MMQKKPYPWQALPAVLLLCLSANTSWAANVAIGEGSVFLIVSDITVGGSSVASIGADIFDSTPDFDSGSSTGDAGSSSSGAADLFLDDPFSLTVGDELGTFTSAEAVATTGPSEASHTRYDYIYMDIDNTAGVDDIEIFFDFDYGIGASLSNTDPGLTTADIYPLVLFTTGGGIFDDILDVGGGFFSNDSVGTVDPFFGDLGSFSALIGAGEFAVFIIGAEVVVEASITAAVPIPAGVWLLGSALGLLGWMRRKTT